MGLPGRHEWMHFNHVPLSPGFVLAGRYQLIEQLGAGAMGSVWRAEDRKLGAEVAIKLIDARHSQSREIVARFRREAQVAAAIRSTYVVQILDCGSEDEVGACFIAMELLQGETLAVLLERERTLEPRRVAHLLGHVGRALSVAHEKGIVHRDLKPDNVFLVREGDEEVAKVLDFGIARWRDSSSDGSQLETLAGVLIGTPSYMSPEQATGQAADHQSDIWAYGAIAFECLTGQRPYKGETLSLLFNAICAGDQPVPSRLAPVPEGFDAWFAQANARDKSLRFSCIKQAAEQLRRLCNAQQGTARESAKVEHNAGEAPLAIMQLRSAAAIPPKVLEARTDPGRRRTPWTSPAAIACTFTAMALGSFWVSSSKAHDPRSASGDRNQAAASLRVERPASLGDVPHPETSSLSANCLNAEPKTVPQVVLVEAERSSKGASSNGAVASSASANGPHPEGASSASANGPHPEGASSASANSASADSVSADSASANGLMAEGASSAGANGASANGASANGASANGAGGKAASGAPGNSAPTTTTSADPMRPPRSPAQSERRVQDPSDRVRARESGGLGDRNAAGF